MTVCYSYPSCRKVIEYRPNRWAPWQANEPFRCQNCSAMVRLKPTAATQAIRVFILIVLAGGEAAMLSFQAATKLHLLWLAAALAIACGLLFLRLSQLLHLVLPHRIVPCRDV